MMKSRNIFERDRAGEEITHQDEGYYKIRERIDEVQKILFELNGNYHTDEEIRNLFSQLTGCVVDPTFRIRLPFYTDFGKNIFPIRKEASLPEVTDPVLPQRTEKKKILRQGGYT